MSKKEKTVYKEKRTSYETRSLWISRIIVWIFILVVIFPVISVIIIGTTLKIIIICNNIGVPRITSTYTLAIALKILLFEIFAEAPNTPNTKPIKRDRAAIPSDVIAPFKRNNKFSGVKILSNALNISIPTFF